MRTAADVPLLIAAVQPTQSQAGIEVLTLPAANGRPSIPALLDELGRRRMTNVLVEGGSEVLGSFRDADAIDEVLVFIAPKLIGGSGKSALAGQGAATMAEGLKLARWGMERIEDDVLLHGWRE
jgi:diaminohydroxyphosphoribosylaminopyrimidine deaminase/5-amino-6-(5-phosphoribosylamino)uracil reductase